MIEIADTSTAFDLSAKPSLYARAGMREHWVLDLNRRALFVHRQIEQSTYRGVKVLSDKDCASPRAAPNKKSWSQDCYQVADR